VSKIDQDVSSGVITDPPAGRWSALAVLAAALVLGKTTWFSASAVLPQLAEQWALSPSAGAWLTIAVQLGFVIGALTSALLTLPDVVPPRRLFLIGATGAAAANALLLTAGGSDGGEGSRWAFSWARSRSVRRRRTWSRGWAVSIGSWSSWRRRF
jgi:hypothetical protein